MYIYICECVSTSVYFHKWSSIRQKNTETQNPSMSLPTASPAPSARSVRLDISPQTSPRPASRYSKDGGLKTVNPYYYSVYSININIKKNWSQLNTKHQEATNRHIWNRSMILVDSMDFVHELTFAIQGRSSRSHRGAGLAHAHLHVSRVTPAVPERKNVPRQGAEKGV